MPAGLRGLPVAPVVAVLVALAAVGLVIGALEWRARQADDRFDLVRWEIETIPNRWLGVLGEPFRDWPDDDEVLATYFALTPDARERERLENRVERIIEGRIDQVLAEMGLSARISLPGSVFPPVDVELARSPRVLVVSPREVIRRDRTDLLRPDLGEERILSIEASVERGAERPSALVVGSGGVATYPAIVSDRTSYRGVVSTAAHEWVHHYLAFYPLGFRYAASLDLRTINETVADLVGDEVARIVLDRWGDPTEVSPAEPEQPPATPPSTPPSPAVDSSAVLRELRLEVDALLEGGEVEAAERRMEEVRQELEDAGFFIRRINQAFFAWYGTYAARPDAVDPLGGYLRGIRERSETLPEFLAAVRGVGSREDVESLYLDMGGELESRNGGARP